MNVFFCFVNAAKSELASSKRGNKNLIYFCCSPTIICHYMTRHVLEWGSFFKAPTPIHQSGYFDVKTSPPRPFFDQKEAARTKEKLCSTLMTPKETERPKGI